MSDTDSEQKKTKTAAKKSGSKSSAGKLLVVESPAKARTLSKFLGKEFQIKASVGHVRDLPQKGNARKGLGIDIENDFAPDYQIIPGKEKVVSELRALAQKASAIYLAPDPDREGEAIAWHLAEVLDLKNQSVYRITYSSVTKKAVSEALEHPRSIDMNLVNAQQSRRLLDRLVGFNLSPFLWKKVAMNLSAGRVQSVAVRLVVAREKEIRAFVPKEYWKILANLEGELSTGKKSVFSAELVQWAGKKFALGSPAASTEKAVREVVSALEGASYQLVKVIRKESRSAPSAPFITSTLQQSASNQLSFAPSRTMLLAQKLYEGVDLGPDGTIGLITYMRTDSVRIDPEANLQLRSFIEGNFPAEYLSKTPRKFGAKASAQDAHEAIRPTAVEWTPERVKPYLDRDSFRLYELIWKRFVASQMADARYALTTFQIEAGDGLFESRGRVLLFDGFTKLWREGEDLGKGDEQNLPELDEGTLLRLLELLPSQHFTTPPNRYTEAGLVKALEKEGIGRPSTYAPIIKTIKDRGYVVLQKRSFEATELGIAITEVLEKNFPEVMDLQFTASMETDLDKIAQGQIDWIQMMRDFYTPFHKLVEKGMAEAEPLKGRPYEGPESCPLCKSSMVIRYSRNGAFLSCSRYPECKGLLQMPGEGETMEEREAENCVNCGKPMLVKTSRFGKKFLACSGYPECKTTKPLQEEAADLPKIEHDCEECGKPMQVKNSRLGIFLACSGYPECKHTHPLGSDGNIVFLPKVENEVCEKCDSPMAVKMGWRGPFLACTAYPKCRNARPLPGEGTTSAKPVSKAPKKAAGKKKTAVKKSSAKS